MTRERTANEEAQSQTKELGKELNKLHSEIEEFTKKHKEMLANADVFPKLILFSMFLTYTFSSLYGQIFKILRSECTYTI